MLAILQHSDDGELVAETLATLTPSDRENSVSGSLAALRRSQDAVHQRVAANRTGAAGESHFGGDSAVNLFAGDGFQPGKPGGCGLPRCPSMAGKQPAFASENYLFGGGIDFPRGERFVIGGSVFAGFSNLRHERPNDASRMKTVLGFVYGSFTRYVALTEDAFGVSGGGSPGFAAHGADAQSRSTGCGASPARTPASPVYESTTSVRTRSPGLFSPATVSAYCGPPVELKAFIQVVSSPY